MNKKHIKTLLIQECAKLMVFEGVSQYYDAKKIAAKRICNDSRKHLPSNGEISDAVYQLSLQDTQFDHINTLLKMRLKAIEYMEKLKEFTPRLIGSVSTGKIKQGSDIDLHVFCDSIDLLLIFLDDSKIQYELKEVQIQVGNKQVLYQHIYILDEFDIELSVYAENELRVTTKSSTDGQPIKRLSIAKVQALIETDHWEDIIKLGDV